MTTITTDKTREIIEDFALQIARKKSQGAKPQKTVIEFRHDQQSGTERDIYYVPVELLRFRKDNGRISSDVYSYEKNYGPLVEKEEETQKILAGFLRKKDPEKTTELKKSIMHSHQKEPAIITTDGFLINGNRRKMVFELLQQEFPGNQEYKMMKVVILPGEDEDGGAPTVKEIEQIENRYQLQSDGKAEYYNFDRALSIRRKIDYGISLEEQLGDDPSFVGLSKKELNKKIEEYRSNYLEPLVCVDEYLDQLKRPRLYHTISSGIGDPEGRWQAFLDYYNSVYKKLKDEKKRTEMGVIEDEVGKIQDIAFKLIRKREFPDTKLHVLMRDLPKLLSNEKAKTELLKLSEITNTLPESETRDENGDEYKPEIIDKKWGEKNKTEIMKHVNIAKKYLQYQVDQEKPLSLLEDALKKLCHENLHPDFVNRSDIPKAMKLLREISSKANEIESGLYKLHKNR